jgi:sterol desaturase/sphingolipid hydroxylase (fatty acid hydroxylase superfamily)
MSAYLWLALGGGLILLEALVSWRLGKPVYGVRDTEVSLGLAIGWALGGVATTVLTGLTVGFAHRHAVLSLGEGPFALLALLLLADLLYYVWHRLSHRWAWFWATHLVHHTAPRMNMLTAFRQGWTDVLSGAWLVWAPLGLLGFSAGQVLVYLNILLVWSVLMHSEWVPRLGPLDWSLATPANHRVHHSLEPAHFDRNFGGVLIVWDRLFGTYVAEGPAPRRRFGLADVRRDAGPLEIVSHGWMRLMRIKTAV